VAGRTFFGTLRLALLVALLLFVALGAWLDRRRSTDWDGTLRVTVYPLRASEQESVRTYVDGLEDSSFDDVEDFMATEAASYGVRLELPVRIRVSRAVAGLPPAQPRDPGLFSIALWSLRLRYWAWRVAMDDPLPTPDVQVFAVYHPADDATVSLDSVGLSKGLMAVTHLFGASTAEAGNAIVLAHELLHTLGATDKYDPATGVPRVPDGLGDPAQDPLYPQGIGEIMAGRVAVSTDEAVIPESLGQMTVGPVTAREIGWSR
jgi:hypothetical protein